MEKFEMLKEMVSGLEGDVDKFYNKNIKAAAVRIRKTLQEIKKLSQEMRLEITDKKSKI